MATPRQFAEILKRWDQESPVWNALQQGVVLLDLEGRVLRFNRFMREQYGWQDDEMGRVVWDSRPDLVERGGVVLFQHLVETGEPAELRHVRRVGRRGQEVAQNFFAYPIYHEGEVVGVVILVEDVTEEARLIRKAERRQRELEALNSIAATVSESLALDQTLRDALDRVLEITGMEAGTVYVFDEASGCLHLIHSQGLPGGYAQHVAVRCPGEGSAGRALQSGKVIVEQDLAANPTMEASLISEAGFQVCVGVPLRARGRVVGAMSIAARAARPFDPDDIALLTAIGNQIGVAVENARLYERERRRVRQLALLNDLAREMSALLDPDALCQTVTRSLWQTFGYYNVAVLLLDPEAEELVVVAVDGAWKEIIRPGEHRQPLSRGLIGKAVRTGQVVLVNDTAADPDFYPCADGQLAELVMPIRAEGRVIGVINVDADRVGAFTEDDVVILTTVADELEVALEKARLYHAERARAEQVSALLETSRAVSSSLDLSVVLETIAARARELLDADGARIHLLDVESGELRPVIALQERADAVMTITLKVGQGLTGWVAKTGVAALVNQAHLDPRAMQVPSTPVEPECLALAPLCIRDQVIGVMTVSRLGDRSFTESDLELLKAFGRAAAGAIENARLYEELRGWSETLEGRVQARTAELETLYLLSQSTGYVLSYDELFRLVFQAVERSAPSCVAAVTLRAEPDVVYCVLRTGATTDDAALDGAQKELLRELASLDPAPFGPASLSYDAEDTVAWQGGQVRLRVRWDQGGVGQVVAGQRLDWAHVPLAVEGEPVGLLSAGWQRGPFGEELLRVLEMIASQAALSMLRLRALVAAEQRRLERLVEGMLDGVLLLDAEGQVIVANSLGRQLYHTLCSCRDGEGGGDCLFHHCAPRALSAGPVIQELRRHERVYVAQASAVPAGAGEEPAVVLSIHDVTNERQAQEQLFQTSKLASIGELAAGVAHEINNPLAVTVGFSELWLQRGIEDPELRADMELILDAGKRAASIVRNLLAFARSQQKMQRQPLKLNPVIDQALQLVERQYEKENVTIVRRFSPDLPQVQGHPGQLQQVVLNLVQNAKDAIVGAGHGSHVTVNTRRRGNAVCLEVVDDGPGIPEEIQERVFDPFFTTKPPGQGTGLGLSIVHRIVRDHGGQVELHSRPGAGARFVVVLPAFQGDPAQGEGVASELPEAPSPTTPRRVLVVDD